MANYPKAYNRQNPNEKGWNYVPQSWADFFPQKSIKAYNASIGLEVDIKPQAPTWLSFEAFEVPKVEYSARLLKKGDTPFVFSQVATKGKYRFLYPNTQITEAIAHSYNEDSSTFATAMAKIGDKVTSVVGAVTQAFTAGTEGAVYDGPVIWAGMERRRFTISLRLFVFTDVEKDVFGPIKWFRLNSLPSRAQGDTAKRLNGVQYPSVFKITGGAFDTLTARGDLNYFHLLNVNVEYNDTSKLLIGGYPMNARVDLVFQECIKVYRDFMEKKPIAVSINETIKGVNPNFGEYKDPRDQYDKVKFQNWLQKAEAYAKDWAKKSAINRFIENLQRRAFEEAVGFIKRTIMGSSIYKALDDAANLDPVHRLEIYLLMRKHPYKRSGLEPEHLAEVTNSNKPNKVRDETKLEVAHQNEIQNILTKVR